MVKLRLYPISRVSEEEEKLASRLSLGRLLPRPPPALELARGRCTAPRPAAAVLSPSAALPSPPAAAALCGSLSLAENACARPVLPHGRL